MADPNLEPDVRLELYSQSRFLSGVRALVSNIAQRLGFNEIECGQISLAVDEALCNIIKHGYQQRPDGRIWINIWARHNDPAEIKVVIDDLAEQVDLEVIKSRDLADIRPGGLGVHIMREIMDEVLFEKREHKGMRLTMRKKVKATDHSASADEAGKVSSLKCERESEHG